MEDNIKYEHTTEVHNTRSSDVILPIVLKFVNPSSIIDIGCGLGTWLASAKKLGINDIFGVDGYNVDKTQLVIDPSCFRDHNLETPLQLGRKFDLAICLEVGEHLAEEKSDILINSIVSHADTVLFSAAIPFQGGQNHYNEQYIDYWENKFIKAGYRFYDVIRPFTWDNENVEWWYSQNCFLVSRIDLSDKINSATIPRLKNVVHPSLYRYRVNNMLEIKKGLRLEEDRFDNYHLKRPGRKHLLKLLLGLK